MSAQAQTIIQADHGRPAAMVAAGESNAILQVIMRGATDAAVDIDKMERLMRMHEQIVERQARAAFNAAMVRVQRDIGPIVRDAENDHTKSRYARLETISAGISPIYTREGFSLSFGTEPCPIPGYVRIFCDALHEFGHTQRYHLDLPLDGAGTHGRTNKTAIQAHGSTFSYGRRYLTVMIFNVSLSGEDDDGNGGFPTEGLRYERTAPKEKAPVASEPTAYFPDERFQQLLPSYRELIESGRKTAEHVITMLNTKAPLTAEQMETLRSFAPAETNQQQGNDNETA